MTSKLILWMEQVGIKDVPRVGGKNASLGEMIQRLGSKGVRVPHGFIVTADAYRYFLKETGSPLKKSIASILFSKLLAIVFCLLHNNILSMPFLNRINNPLSHQLQHRQKSNDNFHFFFLRPRTAGMPVQILKIHFK